MATASGKIFCLEMAPVLQLLVIINARIKRETL